MGETTAFLNSPPAGIKRLTETVEPEAGRTVQLRTDFIPFTGEYGGNSWLLVYSVKDSGEKRSKLITVFPVGSGFVDRALNPEYLGEDKSVQTRYNAFVKGLTGRRINGSRTVQQY